MSSQAPKKSANGKVQRGEPSADDVFQPPVIQRDPTSRQAKIGAKVVLRVQATGRPIPSFQWFHNGKKIIGATTDRLTLNKIRRLAGGAYHCEVKNFVGKATSRVAILSFFTERLPQLVVEPTEVSVTEGRPIAFQLTSLSKEQLKQFKVFWTFNGKRIRGAHGADLKLSEVKEKYAGVYKAIVSTGSSLETSNPAQLIVKKATQEKAEAVATPPILPREEPEAIAAPLAEVLTEAPTAPVEDFFFNPEEEGPLKEKTKTTDLPVVEPFADPVMEEISRFIVREAELPSEALGEPPAEMLAPLANEPLTLAHATALLREQKLFSKKLVFLEKLSQSWARHCAASGHPVRKPSASSRAA